MEKNLYFDYAALVIEIILVGCLLVRKMTNGKLNQVYIFLSTMAIFTCTSDIIAVCYDRSGGEFIVEKMVFHSIYLMLRAFTSFFCLNYIIILTDTWFKASNGIVRKIWLFLPVGLVVVMMLLNFFTHSIFYISDTGEYTRGSWFIMLYIINGYYVLYCLHRVISNWKMLTIPKVVSIIVATLLMGGAAVFQFLVPDVLIDMFANATGLLFLFMMVQRPEELTDSDTGLIKFSAYDNDITRSFKNKKPETVIMIKVINYKVIREMLGYRDSVMVKKIVADEMLRTVKQKGVNADIYYTESGNFRIKLEGKSRDKAKDIAEYLNDKYKEPIRYHEMQLNLVVCVCITKIPDDIDNMDAMVALGQDLKNRYTGNVLYASNVSTKSRYSIMRDIDIILEDAITEDRFEVYYQPIYSIKDNRFTSAEALLRLYTKKYGFVSPDIFIPAAEKNGMIHRIGQIVMEKVCEFIGSEEYDGLGLDYIEVNLSPAQCMEDDLASNMFSIMKKNKVLPDQVNLEITETAAGDIQNTIVENITTMHNAGISFSLDDFGTGYSNMTRIASLPFCIIKIDKTLARIDESNPNMVIVLENIIKMIKALKMKIVVEGVETKELADKFRELECEYIQGYYYSKPLPKDEFIKFIRANQVVNVTAE